MHVSRPAPDRDRPLLGRGVYELPVLSEQGNPLFLLVDQDHRHVGRARELEPGVNRATFVNDLYAELDRERPTWTPKIL